MAYCAYGSAKKLRMQLRELPVVLPNAVQGTACPHDSVRGNEAEWGD